jgi:DNA-directed RNA polymerase subunit F
MAGRDAILQARCPADLRVVSRALGVNMSEAAIRGVIQAICAAAGITGYECLSSDLEIALLATLRSRRDELASELEELTSYITRIEGLEEERQKKLVEQQLAIRQQELQQVRYEEVRIAREQFLALLPTVSEEAFNRLREHLEDDDVGDIAAEIADSLARQHRLTMPPGSDPGQWLVDHVVKSGGIA